MSVFEELLQTERTPVKRLKRKLTTEIKKRQPLVAERRETSETASHEFADGKDSLQSLRSKIVTITAVQDKGFNFASKVFKKIKTAEVDMALQSPLWKATL